MPGAGRVPGARRVARGGGGAQAEGSSSWLLRCVCLSVGTGVGCGSGHGEWGVFIYRIVFKLLNNRTSSLPPAPPQGTFTSPRARSTEASAAYSTTTSGEPGSRVSGCQCFRVRVLALQGRGQGFGPTTQGPNGRYLNPQPPLLPPFSLPPFPPPSSPCMQLVRVRLRCRGLYAQRRRRHPYTPPPPFPPSTPLPLN